jgi:hypothetical protein
VVEGTALEMRHAGNRIEGSNPSLSAVNEVNKAREGFELVGGRGRRNAPVEEATRNRGFRERKEYVLAHAPEQ